MDRIIATIELSGTRRVFDLDLPADLPTSQLIPLIAQAIGLDPALASGTLVALPEKHRLRPNESLAAAQIWDGARLVLMIDRPNRPHGGEQQAPAPVPNLPPATISAQPSVAWQQLTPPNQPDTQNTPAPSTDGYVWKPV